MTLISCTGKDGSLNFRDIDTGVYIHSNFDPHKESARLYSNLQIPKDQSLICFGLGVGYILSAILESPSPIPSNVIVFEPEKELSSTFPDLKKKS
jgi:hypothetical protein